MSFYDVALFVHVIAAIALVGGSLAAHLSVHLLEGAGTTAAAEAHVGWLRIFTRASGPIAGIVLLAGLYLAFAGDWWGAGWPVVSLVLFAAAGAMAATLVEPSVRRMGARLEVADGGQPPPGDLVEPRMTRLMWLMLGIDLAIVLLMTAKPGWMTSLVTAAVAVAAGGALGERMRHRGHRPSTAPPDAPPAAPAV